MRTRLLLVGTLALAACNKTTPFPPGLEPIDSENQASAPAGTADDPHPQTLNMVSGHIKGYDWVQARAYVHASPALTYRAIHTPKVSADPKIDGPSFTLDVEPTYEYSYKIHYEPSPGIEFEVIWRHGLVDGTDEAPLVTASRFQKTWGTTYINLIEGSVVMRAVIDEATGKPLPDVTALEIIEHLDATASDTGTLREYFGNYFNNILKFVADPPAP